MGTRVLIDSNVLIDFLAGVPEALSEIKAHPFRAISVITWIEVVAGLGERAELRESISANFPVVPLSAEIAEEAALLGGTTRLKLPDAVILATAHAENRVLLTRNTRDFQEGRFVRFPYQL